MVISFLEKSHYYTESDMIINELSFVTGFWTLVKFLQIKRIGDYIFCMYCICLCFLMALSILENNSSKKHMEFSSVFGEVWWLNV